MKILTKFSEGKQVMELTYEGKEWAKLQKKFEEIGLEKRNTKQGLGVGLTLDYYRDAHNSFLTFIKKTTTTTDRYGNRGGTPLIDDINQPFLYEGYTNIAIFRIVPVESKVTVPLGEYITISTVKMIGEVTKMVVKATMEAVVSCELKLNMVETTDVPTTETL